MTSYVTITDTGKRRTSSVSAEETEMANGGVAITLNGVQVTVEDTASLNTQSTLSKLSTPSDSSTRLSSGEVDLLGLEKPKWTARGLLRVTESGDMALVKAIRWLSKTKGYKTVSGDLADWSDGSSNSSTINVRIKRTKITHNSNDNLIAYELDMFETE